MSKNCCKKSCKNCCKKSYKNCYKNVDNFNNKLIKIIPYENYDVKNLLTTTNTFKLTSLNPNGLNVGKYDYRFNIDKFFSSRFVKKVNELGIITFIEQGFYKIEYYITSNIYINDNNNNVDFTIANYPYLYINKIRYNYNNNNNNQINIKKLNSQYSQIFIFSNDFGVYENQNLLLYGFADLTNVPEIYIKKLDIVYPSTTEPNPYSDLNNILLCISKSFISLKPTFENSVVLFNTTEFSTPILLSDTDNNLQYYSSYFKLNDNIINVNKDCVISFTGKLNLLYNIIGDVTNLSIVAQFKLNDSISISGVIERDNNTNFFKGTIDIPPIVNTYKTNFIFKLSITTYLKGYNGQNINLKNDIKPSNFNIKAFNII